MLAAEWGTGQVFLSMVFFFFFFIWVWLLISVLSDLFRSPDLSGWSKALWSLFIIVLPYLGVFVYLIARGSAMNTHALERAERQDQAMRQYVRSAVDTPPSTVDELSKLASLREQGVINEEEFGRMKAKLTA